MKYIDQDNLIKRRERINHLLIELHNSLDLYYETVVENEIASTES